MRLQIAFATVISLSMLYSCKTAAPSNSAVMTNFGASGNKKVTNTFLEYVKKNQHCDNSGTGIRVLLTGLGPFSTAPRSKDRKPYNFSGVLARGFTDEIWPKKIDDLGSATVDPTRGGFSYSPTSRLQAAQQGGYAEQITMNVEGKEIVVCTLLLDVVWDQSAAIIAYEASRFFPDKIIMLGLNNVQKTLATLAIGAVNAASSSPGYLSSGEVNVNNTPKVTSTYDFKPYIVPEGKHGIGKTIEMSWGAKTIEQAMNKYAKDIFIPSSNGRAFSVTAALKLEENNTSILNNLAFIVANAVAGKPLELAGGTLVLGTNVDPSNYDAETTVIALDPRLEQTVKSLGMMLLPDVGNESGKMVFGWMKVLANAMITADTPALENFTPELIPQVSMTKVYGNDPNATAQTAQSSVEEQADAVQPDNGGTPQVTKAPEKEVKTEPMGNQKKIIPVVPKKKGNGTKRVLELTTYTGEWCPIKVTATRSSAIHGRMTTIDLVLDGECGGNRLRVDCDSEGFCGPIQGFHIDLNEDAPYGFKLVSPEKTLSYRKQ